MNIKTWNLLPFTTWVHTSHTTCAHTHTHLPSGDGVTNTFSLIWYRELLRFWSKSCKMIALVWLEVAKFTAEFYGSKNWILFFLKPFSLLCMSQMQRSSNCIMFNVWVRWTVQWVRVKSFRWNLRSERSHFVAQWRKTEGHRASTEQATPPLPSG